MGLFDFLKSAANDSKEKNQAAYEEIMCCPATYDTARMAVRRANSASFSEKAGYNRALNQILYELDDREIIQLFNYENLGVCQGTVCQALERRGYMIKNSDGKYEKNGNWPY